MAFRSLPSVEYLRECFDLNEEAYELFWNERPLHHFANQHACHAWNARFAKKKAGGIGGYGYLLVGLCKQKVLVHRIVHKLLTSEDYRGEFDHKDNCQTNNHPVNLRKATRSQNMSNTRRNTGKYKYRGIRQARSSLNYQAQTTIKQKHVYMGSYPTQEEAHAAYCLAALHFHKEFANFGPNSCFPDFPLTSEFVSKVRHFINKAEEKMMGQT